jgi:hypothetical protein
MNFSNKKISGFEQKFTNGFNHGFKLNEKVPAHLSEEAKYVLHALKETRPKDIVLNGICSGFNHALQIERQKRMAQIKQIEQAQTKGLEKGR